MINIIFGMPGVNCAVTGCGSCRRTKGIVIFKLPSAKDDEHKRWRDEWVGELKKTREVDKDFRRKFNEDKVYACEKHFKDEVIEICKYFLINRACSSVTINIAFEARARALCCTILCLIKRPRLCIFNLINNCILFIVFAVHSKKIIKKRLAFGAIPPVNMPKKSHDIEPIPSRRPLPDRPLWL